jgi:hypothetical protein
MNIKSIFAKFCNEYKIKISPKNKFKAKIVTPFGGLNSDPITFIAELDENYLYLNDNLSIYRFYDKNFYDPSNNALDIISSIIKNYEIEEENFYFTKKIPLNSPYFNEEILDYITGLIKLEDIIFLKREIIFTEFLEIVENFIKENLNTKYKYFNESIKAFDDENLYPVNIALSNDNKNFVVINILTSQNKMNEATISMMYYRYETNANLYNISIFEETKKLIKGNKHKRILALSDKILDSFGNFEKKILIEEVERRLHNK